MASILLAYGSRYGATRETAQQIAVSLRRKHTVKLADLTKAHPDPSSFDGVIVASGIKVGRWTRHARKFLEEHKDVLAHKTLGLFVCSATALVKHEEAKRLYLDDVVRQIGLKADIFEAFGPILDFSKNSPLGFLDRMMLKAAAKDMEKNHGLKLNLTEKNDLRDQKKIEAYAEQFSKLAAKAK
ncbi:MAG: flavodoxin domain-containing protein [Nanoarchaeota archaeon]